MNGSSWDAIVSLSLTGDEDFDPYEFTARSGATPTRQWRKGEDHGGRRRQHSFWKIEKECDPTVDDNFLVLATDGLLNLVEPNLLTSSIEVKATRLLKLLIVGDGEPFPSFSLPVSLIVRLGRLKFDFEFVCNNEVDISSW
jgi:Domain of unknown function (DUF4279)